MINLYEKGRIPSEAKEILTKSFLIDKIANDMKAKYKKVFSFINYDETMLKNDIHYLLSKYISNNKKEINIKYIETTLLNKVREKYRRNSPFKATQKKNPKNNKLIKVINSSSKKNIYLKKEENKENKLTNKIPVIKNINKDFVLPKINNNHSQTCEEMTYMNKRLNELESDEKKMQEEIDKEKEEIAFLEQYKEKIQKQINEINKELEKENENVEKKEFNEHRREIGEGFIWANNPSMSLEQMKYLERKKKIEEDVNNKQNKYIFLKPGNNYQNINDNNSNTIDPNKKRPFHYNKIKINNYSMDNMQKIYLKNKGEEITKEPKNRSNSSFDRYNNEYTSKQKRDNSCTNIKSLPYEDKIKLKVLRRSLAQEKAFNHLRNILSPEKEFLNESNYQGFNSNINEDKKERQKKEYELADKARKIQVEKMRKLLDENICEKEKRKKAEKEFDKKYRELNDIEYKHYLGIEKQDKLLKQEKIEKYRKMLEEQIEQKKKLMLKDEINQGFNLDMFNKNL